MISFNNMISYLEGEIIRKGENFVLLKTNGVGFLVFCSEKTLNRIPQKETNLKMFCHLDVGERSLKLYGFLEYKELDFFKMVRNISGIGPKAALEISSLQPLEKIKKEIKEGHTKIFEDIPGIGKKKAQKIILELSGKIVQEKEEKRKEVKEKPEEINALVNLGFSEREAKKALSEISPKIKNTEERIKKALEILGRA